MFGVLLRVSLTKLKYLHEGRDNIHKRYYFYTSAISDDIIFALSLFGSTFCNGMNIADILFSFFGFNC